MTPILTIFSFSGHEEAYTHGSGGEAGKPFEEEVWLLGQRSLAQRAMQVRSW